MKKRITAHKKVTRPKTQKRTAGHLHIHKVFIISSGSIFALALLFAIAHVTLQPLAAKNDSQYLASTNVLGDEDKSGEDAQKAAEEQKHNQEQATEQAKHAAEQNPTIAPDSIKVQTQSEGKKSESEIETSNGQKIKTKVEDDGTAKIEFEHNDLKIHYEIHNGTISATAEDHKGKEIKLDENKLNDVENTLEEDGIKIASGDAGQIIFGKNKIAARTHFPLSIDTGTHQLVVTTPAGQKVVTVLPDQAVQNMLATGVISSLNSGGSGTGSGNVEFTVQNNEPVYKIEGLKNFKFLGFIPVSQPVTAVVSSETGNEIKTEEPFLTQVVDLLSP